MVTYSIELPISHLYTYWWILMIINIIFFNPAIILLVIFVMCLFIKFKGLVSPTSHHIHCCWNLERKISVLYYGSCLCILLGFSVWSLELDSCPSSYLYTLVLSGTKYSQCVGIFMFSCLHLWRLIKLYSRNCIKILLKILRRPGFDPQHTGRLAIIWERYCCLRY